MNFVPSLGFDHFDGDETLFKRIADDLTEKGWSVIPNAIPNALASELFAQVQLSHESDFAPAGVGRSLDHSLNPFVRSDEIKWIEGETEAEKNWLSWTSRLQSDLNRRLFLGLFSFESHFAHYRPGTFYKKHFDAFKGHAFKDKTNRVLSVVAYLNPGWLPDDGGELVMHEALDKDSLRVTPAFGTLVVFLSEEVLHEVLPAARDRYSIAGWFRVNNSLNDHVDPPR
ncbi:MAG: 2OG-Fe(II) oxygenase [Pseudohongiellaceae bacterium]|nr:2OG-Fe(II) oxygenase [Pseudohongiellaceae bacterium]